MVRSSSFLLPTPKRSCIFIFTALKRRVSAWWTGVATVHDSEMPGVQRWHRRVGEVVAALGVRHVIAQGPRGPLVHEAPLDRKSVV